MTLSGLASLVHHATLSRHAVLCDVVNTSCSSLFSSSLPSHPPRYYLGSQSFTSRLGGISGECMLLLGWHTVRCQFTVFSWSIHMYFWLIALLYDLIHTWYVSLGPTAHQRGRQVLFGRSWTHSRRSETYASAAHAV